MQTCYLHGKFIMSANWMPYHVTSGGFFPVYLWKRVIAAASFKNQCALWHVKLSNPSMCKLPKCSGQIALAKSAFQNINSTWSVKTCPTITFMFYGCQWWRLTKQAGNTILKQQTRGSWEECWVSLTKKESIEDVLRIRNGKGRWCAESGKGKRYFSATWWETENLNS